MPAGTGTATYPATAQPLSLHQLAALWVQAGGDSRYAQIMARIAQRESGGNPDVQNLRYPDHSIGLWQINQLAHRGAYGTDTQLKDPLANARAAVAVFNASKASGHNPMRPWATYNPDIDDKYIGIGATANAGVNSDGIGGIPQTVVGGLIGAAIPGVGALGTIGGVAAGAAGVVDDGLDAVTAPFRAFKDIGEALGAIWHALTDPKTWLRVLMFIGGLALGVLAFQQLATAARAS